MLFSDALRRYEIVVAKVLHDADRMRMLSSALATLLHRSRCVDGPTRWALQQSHAAAPHRAYDWQAVDEAHLHQVGAQARRNLAAVREAERLRRCVRNARDRARQIPARFVVQ